MITIDGLHNAIAWPTCAANKNLCAAGKQPSFAHPHLDKNITYPSQMAETTDFPVPSLADLSLFPATYEQIIESRKRSAVQWSGNMALEEYLQRDVILDGLEHAADGRFVTW